MGIRLSYFVVASSFNFLVPLLDIFLLLLFVPLVRGMISGNFNFFPGASRLSGADCGASSAGGQWWDTVIPARRSINFCGDDGH